MPTEEDEFLMRAAAFAKSLGAPEGTHAFILGHGQIIPIIGSVNGRNSGHSSNPSSRLQQAREALRTAELRTKRRG